MFIRRGGSAEDPWLNEKLWIFTTGAVVALLGMLLDNLWLMAGAGVILAGGIALRFVPRGADRQTDGDPAAADAETDEDR